MESLASASIIVVVLFAIVVVYCLARMLYKKAGRTRR